MVDIDFDGTISKKDLNDFLLNVLKVPAEEVTIPRLERVFKLLDQFKRGYILNEDFKKLFEKNAFLSPSSRKSTTVRGAFRSSSMGRTVSKLSQNNLQLLDWKSSARQQVGLMLAKLYPDLKTSFEGTVFKHR
jgi:hypothetical protein